MEAAAEAEDGEDGECGRGGWKEGGGCNHTKGGQQAVRGE